QMGTRSRTRKNPPPFCVIEFGPEGESVLRARAYGKQSGKALPKLSIELDRKPVQAHDVDAVEGKPKVYEARVKVAGGRQRVSFSFTNEFEDKDAADADAKKRKRGLFIEGMEIEGPFNPVPKALPESHRRIM